MIIPPACSSLRATPKSSFESTQIPQRDRRPRKFAAYAPTMNILTHIRALIARLRGYRSAASCDWILRFESQIDPRVAATIGR